MDKVRQNVWFFFGIHTKSAETPEKSILQKQIRKYTPTQNTAHHFEWIKKQFLAFFETATGRRMENYDSYSS